MQKLVSFVLLSIELVLDWLLVELIRVSFQAILRVPLEQGGIFVNLLFPSLSFDPTFIFISRSYQGLQRSLVGNVTLLLFLLLLPSPSILSLALHELFFFTSVSKCTIIQLEDLHALSEWKSRFVRREWMFCSLPSLRPVQDDQKRPIQLRSSNIEQSIPATRIVNNSWKKSSSHRRFCSEFGIPTGILQSNVLCAKFPSQERKK